MCNYNFAVKSDNDVKCWCIADGVLMESEYAQLSQTRSSTVNYFEVSFDIARTE